MKRKFGPIKTWKVQYNYVSAQIRLAKTTTRNNQNWGKFKTPKVQSHLTFLQQLARELMEERPHRQKEAQELYNGLIGHNKRAA